MKSVEYLEKLQYEKRMNDTQIAIFLNISKAAISQYKSGNRVMNEETCLAIAFALNIEPMQILAAAGMERAQLSGQKSLWEVFMMRTQKAKNAGVTAALGLALVTNLLTPTPAKAAPVLDTESTGLYIMSNRRRKGSRKTASNITDTVRTFLAFFTPQAATL